MEFARKEGFDFVPEKKREEGPKLVYRREVLLAQFWSRALLGVILFIAFIAGAWVAQRYTTLILAGFWLSGATSIIRCDTEDRSL